MLENKSGYTFEYDYTNEKVKAYSSAATSITAEDFLITDDDSAASNGTDIYLHTNDGVLGWFESVCANNADAPFTLTNGGSTCFVFDSDAAATKGFAVYFDDDAATQDQRLLAACPSLQTIYVPTSIGTLIPIIYNAAPDTPGNALHFDDNAANTYERVLCITANNADANASTDDSFQLFHPTLAAGVATEVAAATNLSAVTGVRFTAIGII
jgi:hypothetical protein